MNDRKVIIEYKGYEIHYYRGSNWVYINTRIFGSLRSAKMWVNKQVKNNNEN